MISVYDNLISKELQDKIENNLISNSFSWYLNEDTVGVNRKRYTKGENIKEYLQFTHLFYRYDFTEKKTFKNSNTEIVDELLNEIMKGLKLNKFEVFRLKANLQTQFIENKKEYFNTPHIDIENLKNKICLYYVNDSDGDTLFFDSLENLGLLKKVEPKKGRIVIFDGDVFHAGQHPIKSAKRIVININYKD
tara:strand:+ start:4961 stop:5536 length:576 start_codon:yes stop_codon:yes gene_type:complete